MGVGGRRMIRWSGTGTGTGREHNNNNSNNNTTSVLPIITPNETNNNTNPLSTSCSCWYCDLKISSLNPFFTYLGRKHARFLRIWFTMGSGFGLAALVGVTLILLWEFAAALRLCDSYNAATSLLFGILPSPSVSGGFGVSAVDGGYIILSTLISVVVHEFGHAIAATSEGVQIEYIAIFLAVLFPGALVAFNYDMLQCVPQNAALRIYCAGIWHNAVCCAACALILFLLPLAVFPFYIHGQNLMVLDVPSASTLSDYLSPGDIIVSLDGLEVQHPQEWTEKLSRINANELQNSHHLKDSNSTKTVSVEKGYCIPNTWVKDQKIELEDDQYSCPDGLTLFSNVPCLGSNLFDDKENQDDHLNSSGYCLSGMDVVQLKKCGNGWPAPETIGGSCLCLEDETCVMPLLMPGLIWVEITYKRPYSSECLERISSTDVGLRDSRENNCGGTFVFIGHVLSIVNSVWLSAYQPRWAFALGLHIPNMLEKLCACTFHVSLTLVLLNSLPVFLLDGGSIVEVAISFICLWSHRKRAKVLQICLFAGSLLSILAISRVIGNFL